MMKHFKLALIVILFIIGFVVANNEANEASSSLELTVGSILESSTEPTDDTPLLNSALPGLCDIVPTSREPLKFLVPLYVYPGAVWDQVIQGASKVPTMVIINPHSGPTPVPSTDYSTYMNKLQNAGIEMIGYVYTSYGSRSIDNIKKDIDTYAAKYPHIIGIFFDEVSRYDSDLWLYTQAYNHVVEKGFKHSILNPGAQTSQSYLAISTSIVIFEAAGSQFTAHAADFPSYVKCAPSSSQKSGYKYKFAAVAHSTQPGSAPSLISSVHQQGLGLIYITDGLAGCCTYNNLVTYYTNEAASIQTINK